MADADPVGPVYRGIGLLERVLLRRLFRRDWSGQERLPARGGVIIVANHISYSDPVILDWFLIESGRWPRFLAKADLFTKPVIGWLGRSCGQIPVLRNTGRAGDALVAAEAALADGQCVVLYPEGTVTKDPQAWPMTGRRGAARLALRSGCPVVPVGQWGAHEFMPPPRPTWPRPFPRKTISMRVGEPLDLVGLDEAAVTERILDAITGLVAGIRQQSPPGRWDPRRGARVG